MLVSAESYAPMDRTKLSKALVDDENKLQWRTPEVLKNDFKVDFKPSTVSPDIGLNRKANMPALTLLSRSRRLTSPPTP